MTRLTIDPVTRLEGHGKIEILLDEHGNVAHTYFQVPELRGFEQLCVGRPLEEMPTLTSRICGVCPEAHFMAAAKAVDAAYGVTPPRPAQLLRELLYSAFIFADHTTHFYVLSGPDFLVGPDAPKQERNILGVIHRVGVDVGRQVIRARQHGHRVIELCGGRKVHPVTSVPGGVTKGLTAEERAEVVAIGKWMVEFAGATLDIFDELILGDPAYLEMIRGETYTDRTYYMGLVDDVGTAQMFDGHVRVVAPDGSRLGEFAPAQYSEWIAERVEPWTYLKFPYLRPVGWQGLVGGSESGVYCVGPLARLNVAERMATPRAQAAFEKLYATLAQPQANGSHGLIHQRMAMHWARLVELMAAAERVVELAADDELTSDDLRVVVAGQPSQGVGCVEAPRGTLFHHYWSDDRGLVTRANLIVATTNNYAPIAMSVERAARSLIHAGRADDGLLNRVEMAFRAYDPCFGCATHSLTGEMPLEVTIHDAAGEPIRVLRQNC